VNRDETGRNRGIAFALGAAVISGLAVFINGYGVRAVPDATVYTTAKNLVAALLLGLLVAVSTRRVRSPVGGPRRPPVLLAGLLGVAVVGGSIPFVPFFEGLARASSTHAAFVHKTLVVWVAALAVPLLAERFRSTHVAAVALLLTGLVLLDGGLRGFRMGTGEWLILAATLLWAIEVVVAKRLLRDVPAGHLGLARMGLGVLLLLGWLAATGRLGGLADMGIDGWWWAAVTGLILAGYVATWFTALAYAPAIDVTAVLVVGAVVTGILSSAVHGTVAAPTQVAGWCSCWPVRPSSPGPPGLHRWRRIRRADPVPWETLTTECPFAGAPGARSVAAASGPPVAGRSALIDRFGAPNVDPTPEPVGYTSRRLPAYRAAADEPRW
jgi:drug/metabolite transporter (DMT)-like permease